MSVLHTLRKRTSDVFATSQRALDAEMRLQKPPVNE